MKKLLLIFSLLLCLNSFGQKLPITGLCWSTVHTYFSVNCNSDAFAAANSSYFDAIYAKAGGDWLSEFRNYGPPDCTRPTGLTTATAIFSSQDYASFVTIWDAYGAKWNACNLSHNLIGESCQYASLTVGQTIYYLTGTNCTTLADGWYFFESTCPAPDANSTWYYHVVSGVLTEFYQGPS